MATAVQRQTQCQRASSFTTRSNAITVSTSINSGSLTVLTVVLNVGSQLYFAGSNVDYDKVEVCVL